MRSRRTKRFRKLLRDLPEEAQRGAVRAYQVWRADPLHPSLSGAWLQGKVGYYRVEILGNRFRAIAHVIGDDFVWDWIGPHSDYDHEVRRI